MLKYWDMPPITVRPGETIMFNEYERRTKMKEFKPGDKVRVLDYRGDRRGHESWVPSMDKYVGEILTIHKQCADLCFTEENGWNWHRDWLVPVNFTKDDIQEFDVVEFRDGRMSLVVDLDDALEVSDAFISAYKDDLTLWDDEYADIMKVYRPKDNLPTDKSKWKDLPLIWKREEVKEMTVDEISEALGFKVKVVGEEV